MTTTTKIEIRDGLAVGDAGYLIQSYNQTTKRESCHVQARPGRKNLSGEECADGWLGDTNNVSRRALGRVRVTALASGPCVGDPDFGTVEPVA